MGGAPGVGKDGKKQGPMMSLVKGTITGLVEAVICYPTEYVKTQLQLQSKSNPGEC
jgi:solute carrier family 25 citrate transporter 1